VDEEGVRYMIEDEDEDEDEDEKDSERCQYRPYQR